MDVVDRDREIMFLRINYVRNIPSISYCLAVQDSLEVQASVNGLLVAQKEIQHLLEENKVPSFSAISNLIAYLKAQDNGSDRESGRKFVQDFASALAEITLEDEDLNRKLGFLQEQLSLLLVPKQKRKYSTDLLTAALMWKATSPVLYRQLLNEKLLTLPSLSHLQKLSRIFTTETGVTSSVLSYLKLRIEALTEEEKLVSLLIDEIHSAQRVEYAGGQLYGKEGDKATKTVLSFMVKSIAGKYSDIVALFPVSNLDSKILQETFLKVVSELTKLGLKVVAISVDNATPNRKFFIQLCGGSLSPSVPHPVSKNEVLFLLFDSVHNFKNLYNNFHNRRELRAPGFDDEEELHGHFRHLEELYELELGKPAKLAYKLTEKVLHPSAIERTNVKLADAVFHDSTISALEFYSGNHPEWGKTAKLLKLIRHWWNIVNVKTPHHGDRKRDSRLLPFSAQNQESDDFVRKMSTWLCEWQAKCKEKNSEMKGLTNETFLAMIQTSRALPQVASYLMQEKKFPQVLLGQLQSDPIEKRFGWYRQLAGANYYVSVRQILEAEKVIRIKSLLKFSNLSLEDAREGLEDDNEADSAVEETAELLLNILDKESLTINCDKSEDRNIVFYIAGYIARSLSRPLKCEKCVNLLKEEKPMQAATLDESCGSQDAEKVSRFLEQINRGGLSHPSDLLYVTSLHIWTFYEDIVENIEAKNILLQSPKARKVFVRSFIRLCGASDTHSFSSAK